MMPTMAERHKSTGLKQQNKKHNKLGHKSKGQVRSQTQGRLSILSVGSKKAKYELNRQERRNQVKVVRADKKEKTFNRKRRLGTDTQPPFLVCVIVLSPTLNPRQITSVLTQADPQATITISKTGTLHISCQRFKQRYSFVVPPISDLYAILDTVKVCNSVLIVWPCGDRSDDDGLLTEEQQRLISCIKAQGLPTTIHATMGYEQMASKRKAGNVANLLVEVRHFFPECDKPRVFHLDKATEGLLCLRQVGAQKQSPIFYRDHRPHLMAEQLHFQDDPDSASSGTLQVTGYLRGVGLSVNSLVHIPGCGDYQLSQIVVHSSDPHPLVANSSRRDSDASLNLDKVIVTDSEKQDSLASCRDEIDEESDDDSNSNDSGNDGSETDDDDDDNTLDSRSIKSYTTVPVKKDKIPDAFSAYQAAWMMGNDAYKEDSDGYSDSDEAEDQFQAPPAQDDAGSSSEEEDDQDDRMSTASGSDISERDEAYDEKMDYGNEMDEYEKITELRDDLEFPDELDTPRDVECRERFHKFRGLESFRSSPWDLSENLPADYKRIFQIPRFQRFKKRILSMDTDPEAIPIGQYITLHIQNVQKHLYNEHLKTGSPLVVFGLLPHEQKMTMMNFVIKSHHVGHTKSIRAKDRLIFHVGFRRFSNQPIFSDHTGGDKQKFCRFFHPGTTVVASVFAPVTYPPASVLVFRPMSSGRQELIATGSVYSANSDRCMLKKYILTGHPFKIHKRTVTVRYMFFNRDDINWYKPIELRTKFGRRGKIREPLGTRGHMKCSFNSALRSNDTIMLVLYKRVFPKWTYDSFVTRPPLMYTADSFDQRTEDDASEEEETEEDDDKFKVMRDRTLMPPPSKKPKHVHFTPQLAY